MPSSKTVPTRTRMPHRDRFTTNYRVDIVALLSGAVALSSGCVLWTQFHIGDGAFNVAALGIGRLMWLNVHRLAGLVAIASLIVHVLMHRHVVGARMHAWAQRPAKLFTRDFALYLSFVLMALAALVAWFGMSGSTPLTGPVALGRLPPARHAFIDVHNFASLAFLFAAGIHLRRRWRSLLQFMGTGHRSPATASRAATKESI